MRKLILLVSVLLIASSQLMAASTDQLVLYITPSTNLSVLVDASYNFGADVALGDTTMNATAISIENDGDVTSYWQKACGNDDWTLETNDTAVLTENKTRIGILCADTKPDDQWSDFDLSDADVMVTGSDTNISGGGNKGAAASSSLWLRLEAPNSVDVNGQGQQTMTMTITAVPQP